MAHNYAEYGIEFLRETVSKQSGANASDRKVLGEAPIAKVTSVAKYIAHFGEDSFLGAVNGTSIRVMSQDVGRRGIAAGHSWDQMCESIYNRMRGTRNRATQTVKIVEKIVEKEVVMHPLPDKTMYTGTDEMEYRQTYMALLVETGVPVDLARQIAESQAW